VGRRGPALEGLEGLNAQGQHATVLLLALIVVQALFEPDDGSYLKHVVPMPSLSPVLFLLTTRPPKNKTTQRESA
jgi:hypothetical protein